MRVPPPAAIMVAGRRRHRPEPGDPAPATAVLGRPPQEAAGAPRWGDHAMQTHRTDPAHEQPTGRWILGRERPARLDLPHLVHWRDGSGAVVRLITSAPTHAVDEHADVDAPAAEMRGA